MIGTQIGHYILEKELGRGTYGVVWRGIHQHDPDLKVAIKIVHPSLVTDPAFVHALKEECRRLDRLDHAGIVRFRDLVVADGLTAMVLELLEGEDLHDRLRGRGLDAARAAGLTELMLDGLAYAHSRGVVHRDIKPSNIFWCDDGRVKLLDFGVARAADGAQATKTGQLAGTLDYMAPERFQGQSGPAMDVYAIGLVAWEIVAGKPACPEGDLAAKMGWHLAVGAPRLRTVRPECPAWFEEVVAKLCARDVAQRPRDGAAALAMFREAKAKGLGVTASLAWSGAPADAPAAAARRAPPGTVTANAPRKPVEAMPTSVPLPTNPPGSLPPSPSGPPPVAPSWATQNTGVMAPTSGPPGQGSNAQSIPPASLPPTSLPPANPGPVYSNPPNNGPLGLPPGSNPPPGWQAQTTGVAVPPAGFQDAMASAPPQGLPAYSLPPGSLPPGTFGPGSLPPGTALPTEKRSSRRPLFMALAFAGIVGVSLLGVMTVLGVGLVLQSRQTPEPGGDTPRELYPDAALVEGGELDLLLKASTWSVSSREPIAAYAKNHPTETGGTQAKLWVDAHDAWLVDSAPTLELRKIDAKAVTKLIGAGDMALILDGKQVRAYNVTTGAPAAVLDGVDAALSPDGQRIAVLTAAGTVGLFATADGKSVATFAEKANSVAFYDADHLLVGGTSLASYDAAGALQWQVDVAPGDQKVLAARIGEEVLAVGTLKKAIAVDNAGSHRREFGLDPAKSVVGFGDDALVLLADGRLMRVDARAGSAELVVAPYAQFAAAEAGWVVTVTQEGVEFRNPWTGDLLGSIAATGVTSAAFAGEHLLVAVADGVHVLGPDPARVPAGLDPKDVTAVPEIKPWPNGLVVGTAPVAVVSEEPQKIVKPTAAEAALPEATLADFEGTYTLSSKLKSEEPAGCAPSFDATHMRIDDMGGFAIAFDLDSLPGAGALGKVEGGKYKIGGQFDYEEAGCPGGTGYTSFSFDRKSTSQLRGTATQMEQVPIDGICQMCRHVWTVTAIRQ